MKAIMNKKLRVSFIGFILIIILSSCESKQESRQESRFVCNCEEQKQLQDFVENSIGPSNNMSDEEMKDVIHQLRKDGILIFCKLKPVWVHFNGTIDWELQKFDSCNTIMVSW